MFSPDPIILIKTQINQNEDTNNFNKNDVCAKCVMQCNK